MTGWYVVAAVMAGLGVAAGALIFIYASPGKPKIGVINVPYTVITENSAFAITEHLHYALREDSIKAVVIKLNSPGGTATASERLYLETRELREQKPVVLVMNDLVASGGFLMAMGASYLYTQPSSITGNVGVTSRVGPLIPAIPGEDIVFSGPYKIGGGSRRDWVRTVDQVKLTFAQIVISERGNKLRISRDELLQGRIYTGAEAVRLGLADEVGSDSHAIQKAGELAGISNYDLVDVNFEVQLEFVKKIERILAPLSGGGDANTAGTLDLLATDYNEAGLAPGASGVGSDGSASRLQELGGLWPYGGLGTNPEDPLPEFPLDIGRPNIYYLYEGHDP